MQKLPDFVAVDLETTGLDFEKDEIIEVALVRFVGGAPTDSVDFLVKPNEAKAVAILPPSRDRFVLLSVTCRWWRTMRTLIPSSSSGRLAMWAFPTMTMCSGIP